jgi:hydrogenase nickel incorporation protein HypB
VDGLLLACGGRRGGGAARGASSDVELRLEEDEVDWMCRTCGCGLEQSSDPPGGAHEHTATRDDQRSPESARLDRPAPVSEHEYGAQSRPRLRSRAPALPISHTRAALRTVRLQRDLLAKNDAVAAATRRRLAGLGVRMYNLIGAPGSGKTAVLEATIRHVGERAQLAVIEGDQATELDSERIRRAGCHALQINTGAGCHLDAEMVIEGVRAIAPKPGSVVFVENVGNLVCPALFDIGEQSKVVVMSVTEGEDRPLKYSRAFRAADVLLLTKIDLLPHLDFDMDRCVAHITKVNPELQLIPVSAKRGDGIEEWAEWIEARRTT